MCARGAADLFQADLALNPHHHTHTHTHTHTHNWVGAAHPEEMPRAPPRCKLPPLQVHPASILSKVSLSHLPLLFQVKTVRLREVQNVPRITQLPGDGAGNRAQVSQLASRAFLLDTVKSVGEDEGGRPGCRQHPFRYLLPSNLRQLATSLSLSFHLFRAWECAWSVPGAC